MLPANVFNLHLIYSPKPIMTGIWCFASANLGPRKQGSLKLDNPNSKKKVASYSHTHFLFFPRAEKFTSTVGRTLYSC